MIEWDERSVDVGWLSEGWSSEDLCKKIQLVLVELDMFAMISIT